MRGTKEAIFAIGACHSPLLQSLALVAAFIGASALVPIASAANDRDLFGDLWTSGIGGRGTATIDGVMHWREWRGAGAVEFVVNLPEGGVAPATLYVMNDRDNLYIGLRLKRSALDAGSSLAIELDANQSGVLDIGDDAFLVNANTTGATGFFDDVRTSCPGGQPGPCSSFDTNLGGTNDGAGAVANDGTYTSFELMHPLDSGDQYDIALKKNMTVGIVVELRLLNPNIADTTFAPSRLLLVKILIH